MSNPKIPEGYQQVMPYLIVENATDFIDFMQKVFGATEKMKVMRTGTLIMHGELVVGNCTVMFADATDEFKSQPAGMFIYVENADSTFKKALSEGATVLMEPADQEYGRSCGVTDPFDNVWWITSV